MQIFLLLAENPIVMIIHCDARGGAVKIDCRSDHCIVTHTPLYEMGGSLVTYRWRELTESAHSLLLVLTEDS